MAFKHINLSVDRVHSLDPQDMLGKTLELPEQILRGLELGKAFAIQHSIKPVSEIEWVGLGGSAIAGDLLKGFGVVPPTLPLRLDVQRFPQTSRVPRVLCSYSGHTIETVRAFEETLPEQIWFSISSGGKLQEAAAKAGVPHLLLPVGYPPRAAVGFVIGAMLALFDEVFGVRMDDYQKVCEVLAGDAEIYRRFNPAENPALDLAVKLIDHTPVFYVVDGVTMPAIALRIRAQFAENAKIWSHSAELPELAHNEVEALPFLSQVLPSPMTVFLGDWPLEGKFTDPRHGLRQILDSMTISHYTFSPSSSWPDSHSRLLTGLQTMLLWDTVTVYLALLKAIDPLEIPVITRLKKLGGFA